jgi:uncharacterized protein
LVDLGEQIDATPWIDTHEHLVEEHLRLRPGRYEFVANPVGEPAAIAEDWSLLIDEPYSLSDLVCAGLPPETAADLHHSSERSPRERWDAIAPYFSAARNTGYLRAVDIATEQLFGLRLGAETVEEIDSRLRALRVEGFYEHVLREVANVSHCHVHSIDHDVLCETRQPDLLAQDLAISPLALGRYPSVERKTGIEVGELNDYLAVIDWCFERYATQAVAVKCAWAYQRPLAVDVPAPPHREFERLRAGQADEAEQRRVEDFLLQRCIDLATDVGLPVKLHLGYLAGYNNPRFRHVRDHVRDVVQLVQANPASTFVLMHVAWPQQEQLLAVAKHHPNAIIDLCWAWILAPRSTQELLARALTTLPATKLLCFGGDHGTVEHVVGHAEIARRGLQGALEDLIASGWLTPAAAAELVPLLMRGNAERIFATAEA